MIGLVRATEEVSEVMQEAVGRLRQGAAEIGQLAVELVDEQIRHNLAIVAVIGRTTNWDGMTLVQADFVWTSMARLQLFTTCCLKVLRASVAANTPVSLMRQAIDVSSARFAGENEIVGRTVHHDPRSA